jgi:hypothetical protein
MKHKKKPEILKEYIDLKADFKDKFKKKKETQEAARERRMQIRDLKENREWDK